ncbi:MAG TPA: GFA family protein [Methylomirabilota bacterium]|nr:GFA family protein [Methylomirabilota bacterium]
MHITGQCHCGHIRYEAEIDPAKVAICHCTDCQALTGSAFRVTVMADKRAVKQTGGAPKIYTTGSDSGRRRLQFFCPECGSPAFTTGEGEDAETWGIRWGSIDQRGELSPKRQIWCDSAAPWLSSVSDLPGASKD